MSSSTTTNPRQAGEAPAQGAPTRTIVVVTATLLGLLGLTVLLSELHLGNLALAAGLGVAAVKALLVACWFMQLRRASSTIRFAACAGLFFFALLLGGVMADILARQ